MDDFWQINAGQVSAITAFVGAAITAVARLRSDIIINRNLTAINTKDIAEVKADVKSIRDDVKTTMGMLIAHLQAESSKVYLNDRAKRLLKENEPTE